MMAASGRMSRISVRRQTVSSHRQLFDFTRDLIVFVAKEAWKRSL